jgi:pyocin large subunit-like protein
MSVQAISWALSVETGSPSAKLVLITIANYADEHGICWPSQELIARQTEQSIDSVQRRIRDLEKSGFLSHKMRRRRSHLYQLLMPGIKKPQSAVSKTENSGNKIKIPQTEVLIPQNRVKTPQLCGTEPSLRTVTLEPSKKDIKKENGFREKRQSWTPPKHGQIAKDKNLIYIEKQRADEWNAYAEDFRRAKGVEPQPTKAGGHWFKITGEAA